MKHVRSLGIVTALVLLGGCSSIPLPSFFSLPSSEPVQTEAPQAPRTAPGEMMVTDENGDVIVQTVDFRPGTSSATVERLAKRFGCTGTQGAGLITEKGPLEVYRMKCENGTTFMAQCELRQCRPMR
ncbi:hypothetical protein EGT07_18980 [Herbaspirillum sp. HC18]|nr:hypothetical protein EGT07_18980 [Herbaspirillum sp. HC18]